MLERVAKLPAVEAVVATVDAAKKGFSAPAGVANRGLLAPDAYAALLAEASVVLGLGDPVLGPNALDALEHGCAVVQVKYAKPRVEQWVNPRLPWRTQHDFADAVGAPWVVSTTLDAFPGAVARAVELQRSLPEVESRLPESYGDAAILERIAAWLAAA